MKLLKVLNHFEFYLFVIVLFSFINLSCQYKKIKILNADIIDFSEKDLSNNVKRLIGNVVLKHENIILKCDTAIINQISNYVKMYNNVSINVNDTFFIYSNYLDYDGNKKIANFKSNVRLFHEKAKLYSEILVYDRMSNVAFTPYKTKIINDTLTIFSNSAYYFVNSKEFLLKDDIKIFHPKYNMFSSEINYNLKTDVFFFSGKSSIVMNEDSLSFYKGWHDNVKSISFIYDSVNFFSKQKFLHSDTLFYDYNNKICELKKDVLFVDSMNNFILKSNYLKYKKIPEIITALDSAHLIFIFDKTDSLYIHSDTIKYVNLQDTFKFVYLYPKVRGFNYDLQFICDSISFNLKDTTIVLHKKPFIWSGSYQISALKIDLKITNDTLEKVYLNDSCMIIFKHNDLLFDQIKGRSMVGFFVCNKLSKVNVNGNAQILNFLEENNEFFAVNKSEASKISFFIKDNKISNITLYSNPTGIVLPIQNINLSNLFLRGFYWNEEQRPISILHIFYK